MKNYTTMGELMKVAETKMACTEHTIKWFNDMKVHLKKEYQMTKKTNKSLSNCPFEVYVLLSLSAFKQKEQNPNQVEIDLFNDICDFYVQNYQEVNEDYKVDKMRCKSLFEYIFTAFDRHNTRNWSLSLSDVMTSFKDFKPQD
jgi:hypothetical protein